MADSEVIMRTISISLSSFRSTLEAAKVLLGLCDSLGDEDASPVAASASLAMAVALDQSVSAALSFYRADRLADTDGAFRESREDGRIDRCSTFKSRVLGFPEIASGGKLTLDRGQADVRSLLRLIELRNRLMHIDEQALSLRLRFNPRESGPIEIEPLDESSISGDLPVQGEIDAAGQLSLSVPPPRNPWVDLSVEDARAHLRAVTRYIEEIIEADDGRLDVQSSGLLRLR
ncbi:MAG TPA: hypothetical protein ENI85_06985 [Deltaproteobacteria bacterium]|nr:hypothetical protein [Deltaproteobacteria bacterium]